MQPQQSVTPILSAKARAAYVNLLRRDSQRRRLPALSENCPGSSDADEDREALQELLSMGMLDTDDSVPEKVVAVDPGIVEARLGAQLRSSALMMLEEARNLTELLRPLIAECRPDSGASDGVPIVRIEGKAAISSIVNEAVQQCAKELFTAQPGGPRPKATLHAIRRQTEALLDRGVKVRTLYQHTAWHDGPTRDYVSEISALGAQIRTLDEFFDRLIIVDRALAVIPANTARDQAVVVRDPAVVRFLAEVFERNWQRAKPFQGSRTPNESSQLSGALRETIIRCLIHGDSDNVIAKRIGLSTRAYASHLARLKADLEAETRFQLGYRLGQLAGSQSSGPEEPAHETGGAGGCNVLTTPPARGGGGGGPCGRPGGP
ncbi:hypothetical protein ACH4Q7_16430, partial [Streptomyces roseolus]|uniref:hypothetical protein n=1 Tax=Streptomyces roseolus TaxID=67358 RepID=UPI0037A93DE2